MPKKAFSLIELLIYVSIFAVVAGLMTSILVTILKVSQKESASIETSEQLSFVMQTVSRLIRESSNIETASADSLKLRMKDSAKDPTCLYRENQIIKLAEGPDSPNNNDNCTPTASNLTSNKVIADKLEFSKITNYPGHDVVSIDIQLTYNSSNPQSQTTRNLKSAIARVSAATFDSDLIPGANNSYDIGFSGTNWKNANFSGNLLVGGNVGIGTPAPGAKLSIDGGDNSFAWGGDYSSAGYIRIGNMQICWGNGSATNPTQPYYIAYSAFAFPSGCVFNNITYSFIINLTATSDNGKAFTQYASSRSTTGATAYFHKISDAEQESLTST